MRVEIKREGQTRAKKRASPPLAILNDEVGREDGIESARGCDGGGGERDTGGTLEVE
jgi:hypothetical protein